MDLVQVFTHGDQLIFNRFRHSLRSQAVEQLLTELIRSEALKNCLLLPIAWRYKNIKSTVQEAANQLANGGTILLIG